MGGHHAGAVDGELDEPFLHRGRGDADGDLSLAGDGKLGELAGLIGEFLLITVVEEDEFEGLQAFVFGLYGDIVDADRIG